MRPREFITLVGGVAAWPVAAHAQQGELVRRIGVLMGFAESDSRSTAHMAAFRDGLQKLGWTESRRNIRIDTRWAAFDAESRQRFAKELITLGPGADHGRMARIADAWDRSTAPGATSRSTISSASVRLQRLRLACRSGAQLIPILVMAGPVLAMHVFGRYTQSTLNVARHAKKSEVEGEIE